MRRREISVTWRQWNFGLAWLFGILQLVSVACYLAWRDSSFIIVAVGSVVGAVIATFVGAFASGRGYTLVLPEVVISVRATTVAALIAGRRRNLGSAWLDDLRGDPDAGQIPTRGQQAAKIAGFFVAATRFRLHDWFGWTWKPVDWMLATKPRRDGFRTSVVGIHAIYIAGANGLHALFTLGLGWLAVTYTFVTGATTWFAKRRGIELASDEDPPQE